MSDLTVIILTFNEAHHIARAIDSVRDIAAEVLVVDSFSTDATVALAEAAGARVVQRGFVSHAEQLQWAIDHGGVATGWTLRLDADEVIEGDLATTIAASLLHLPRDVSGVTFDRKHIFMGRWIRHGGRYPLTLLRLWRTGAARVEQRWMDEHVSVDRGRIVAMRGGFADWNLGDLGFFTAKHNGYATREAVETLAARFGLFADDAALHAQARRTRWAKRQLYDRLPLWIGPLGYFLWRYVARGGFLDGRAGLIYHGLQGFWYRFLVAAKVAEWEAEVGAADTRAARVAVLARLSGLPLT